MTTRTYIKMGVVAAVVIAIVGMALYQFRGGVEYAPDVSSIRDDFNRDRGNVRLIALLSPT